MTVSIEARTRSRNAAMDVTSLVASVCVCLRCSLPDDCRAQIDCDVCAPPSCSTESIWYVIQSLGRNFYYYINPFRFPGIFLRE